MLKILGEVVKYKPDTLLYMIGDGTDEVKAELYQYISEHALTNNVLFTGFISNVEDYYKQAKIMVLTSCIEGFPMVVAECKAYSLPIVAYDLPYVEMIRDENSGVIRVPQGDYSAAASEICKLFSDSSYYDGLSTEAFDSLSKYSNENLEKTWKEIFTYLQQDSKIDYVTPQLSTEDMRILTDTLKYHIQLNKKKYDSNIKIVSEIKFQYENVFQELPTAYIDTTSTHNMLDSAGNQIL